MGPSRESDIGPDDEPLVGDGGSLDETGWEAPTRPDRPMRPFTQPPHTREPEAPAPEEPAEEPR
jgi:hypothetical protein